MRALRVFMVLVLALGALAARAAGVPEALLLVERWKMTFDYEQSASNHTASEDWTLLVTAHGSAILEATHDPDELYGSWVGTLQVDVSYSHIGWRVPFETCRYEDEVIGSGTPLDVEGSAILTFFEDGYQLNPSSHNLAVNHTFRYICPDESVKTMTGRRGWLGYKIIADSIPYPTMGTELQADLQVEDNVNVEQTIEMYPFPSQVKLSYRLTPEDADELKLEIRDSGAYDTWRPSAGAGGSAGEPLSIHAELVTASGRPSPIAVERFVWTLHDTSREPGVAMNFPVGATDDALDLRFEADPGDGGEVSEDGQTLERVILTGTSDEARVVPYDWGGWSVLEVQAFLADGRQLAGKTVVGGETQLRLPKRAASSFIADAWKKENGASGADDADDEGDPPGDGTEGDGLSLYQEYRGFYEGGEHVEGKPAKKDLFIRAVEPAQSGIALFTLLSGLAVHPNLLPSELAESRVINANKRLGPGATPQHAVAVNVYPDTGPGNLIARAVGGPGNPKRVSEVRLMRLWHTLEVGDRITAVAHELFHCVNVHHHGEIDEQLVRWYLNASGDLMEQRPGRAPSAVSFFREVSSDITPLVQADLARVEGKEVVAWLGLEGGQHAGDDGCVMRYDCAFAYVSKDDAARRYRVQEKHGAGLCSAATGTGVNDEGRAPQSRYGDAASGRGACRHQILVSDRVDPPGR